MKQNGNLGKSRIDDDDDDDDDGAIKIILMMSLIMMIANAYTFNYLDAVVKLSRCLEVARMITGNSNAT